MASECSWAASRCCRLSECAAWIWTFRTGLRETEEALPGSKIFAPETRPIVWGTTPEGGIVAQNHGREEGQQRRRGYIRPIPGGECQSRLFLKLSPTIARKAGPLWETSLRAETAGN